jgi:hypothetical protein
LLSGISVDVGGITLFGHRRDWGRDAGFPHEMANAVTWATYPGTG